MSNYACTVRTNYFKVTSEEAYADLMSHVKGIESELKLFTRTAEDGTIYHGFGCFSELSYYPANVSVYDEDDEPAEWDLFTEEPSKLLPEDEAVIIQEAGAEALRYITAFAEIITRHGREVVDLSHCAMEKASQMLKDYPQWTTQLDY